MKENWLAIAVGVYLIGMVLYGHYRGFIRLAVSAFSLIAAVTIVHAASPYVTDFLKNNTGIYEAFETSMLKAVALDGAADGQTPSVQRALIEEMDLPDPLKEALLENNNHEVYQVLGVETFTRYVGTYLANSLINTLSFLLLFVVVFALIRMITVWLDLMAHLPILAGLNQIAGAVLGGVEALFFLWIAALFVTVFAGTDIGRLIYHQIEASEWLSFLYNHNLLSDFVMAVVKTIL